MGIAMYVAHEWRSRTFGTKRGGLDAALPISGDVAVVARAARRRPP